MLCFRSPVEKSCRIKCTDDLKRSSSTPWTMHTSVESETAKRWIGTTFLSAKKVDERMSHRDGKRKWRKIQVRYPAAHTIAEDLDKNFWYDQKDAGDEILMLSSKKARKLVRNWNAAHFFGGTARAVRPQVPESVHEEEQ
jgi:hypothetical protein